jgi:hypothetical protein
VSGGVLVKLRSVLPVLVAVLTLGSCSSGTGWSWRDAADEAAPPVVGTVVVDAGGIRLVESTNDGLPCAQLTVAGETAGCVHYGMGDGATGYGAAARRVGDVRYVDLRSGSGVSGFVVWSSVSPDGRRVEPIRAAGNAILVWIMQPGEAPWGVQILDERGRLGNAVSFVGLPGE